MFLTNNYATINNLMVCSKGKYIPKVIPNYSKNPKDYYSWIVGIQSRWKEFLKNKSNNMQIDFTAEPYGNIKECRYLITNNNGKLKVHTSWGDECF